MYKQIQKLKKLLKICIFQIVFPDKVNCLFDSVLYFFGMCPPGYKGAALRLQLINEMALKPEEYKVPYNLLLTPPPSKVPKPHPNPKHLYNLNFFGQAYVINELLGSGFTYKGWLQRYLQPDVDADIVAVKALRKMLEVH